MCLSLHVYALHVCNKKNKTDKQMFVGGTFFPMRQKHEDKQAKMFLGVSE